MTSSSRSRVPLSVRLASIGLLCPLACSGAAAGVSDSSSPDASTPVTVTPHLDGGPSTPPVTSSDAGPIDAGGIPKGNDTPLPSGQFQVDFVGNSEGAAWPDGPNTRHIQMWFQAIFVAPDGTVYTNSGWDEGGDDAGIYKDGAFIGRLEYGAGGWGRDGEGAITASSKYVFSAMHQQGGLGNKGNPNGLANEPTSTTQTWHCVERAATGGTPAPFATGVGPSGAMVLFNTTDSSTDPNGTTEVAGLAADATHLYVSDSALATVRIFDPETMAELSSFPLKTPGQIVLGPDGTLWIAVGASIVHVSTTGASLPGTITLPPTMTMTSFAIDAAGLLAVADSGSESNVKLYDTTALGTASPTLPTRTFGATGGLLAAGGKIADRTFYNPQGVGFDSSGHLYVATDVDEMGTGAGTHGAGAVLESYDLATGARAPTWPTPLRGLLWVDTGDVDPATEVDMYFFDKHLVYQYGDATGAGWFWTGFTLDKVKYPQDPRLFSTVGGVVNVRHVGGQTLLYIGDQYDAALSIYRLVPGSEIAVPCGYYSKQGSSVQKWAGYAGAGEWLWLDTNGDGAPQASEVTTPPSSLAPPSGWTLNVDSQGNIYTSTIDGTIRTLAIGGLDSRGAPLYDVTAIKTVSAPADIVELLRVDYQPETDTMFLGGYTKANPHSGTEWGIVGTVLEIVKGWSTGNRAATASIVLPYDVDANQHIQSVAYAGDYIFAAEGYDSATIPQRIHIYDSRTGAENPAVLSPPTALGLPGWLDMRQSIQARQRANGEYMLTVEDDGLIRQLVYRWSP